MVRYDEAVMARNAAKDALEELERDYAANRRQLESEVAEAEKVISIFESSQDADAFLVAREIVSVKWPVEERGYLAGRRKETAETKGLLLDSAEDARNGFPILRERYFGVKAYAGWDSQREDHEYGLCPKWGWHWMTVRLRPEYRRKLVSEGYVPTEAEKAAVAHVMDAIRTDSSNADLL